MVYWLLALWEVTLPERNEVTEFIMELPASCLRELRMTGYHQRRRQWDDEAKESVKE